jgi:multidrug efflux pump
MSLSTPFIHRPVGTILLTIAVALAGSLAYRFLPVSPLPEVENPTISVSARLPGASAETMASAVATPLERQFGRIAGVTEMTSNSQLGSTSIIMQFDLSRQIDAAARDVQAAINAARSDLPTNLPGNPTYRKVNPADAPIVILGMTSATYTRGKMYDIASTVLAQKISQLPGVGQVNVGGGALPAVRVEVNPGALNELGLGLTDVAGTLQSANANRPKGQIADGNIARAIAASDQIFHASDYRPLIISYRNGAPVRVSDVADVVDSVEDIHQGGLVNGTPGVMLIISRQPGANIIETVNHINDILPQLQAEIPAGIHLDVVMDRTVTIRGSVNDTQYSLLISVALVILVVFLFLRDVRTTIIPSVAVPISLIGTFGIMYLLDYSIDNLSLMALTIATGFVVDDAIVVVENITRHIEDGMKPLEASLLGAKEIGFTVISMSSSLVAVFIPILLMGGLVGRMFREFAVVLSVAIGVSLIVSLTTTPMMCAILLRSHADRKAGLFYRAGEAVFDWALAVYDWLLTRVLRHPLMMITATLLTIIFTVYLYIIIPKGYFPQQDTGRLMGNIVADQQISSQAMSKLINQFAAAIAADPAVESTVITLGGGFGGGGGNSANCNITLKPIGQRKVSIDQVMARMRSKLASIPGATLLLQAAQDLRIGGRQSNALYQYTLQSDNLDDLVHWAPLVLSKLKSLPGLADVNTSQQDRGLESTVTFDRATAKRLGVEPSVIDSVLYEAFGQAQVSTMYEQLNQYHVVMEVAPQYAQSPEALKAIYVPGTGGAQIPLSAIAKYGSDTTAISVAHQGQFPAVTISFNLALGVSLEQAEDEIQLTQREMGVPESIHCFFAGTAQAFQASMANEMWLIIAAIITVYIVLGMLYESFIHPITILSTLPSAGVGALLAILIFSHFIAGLDLDLIGMIGIILLIGIVKKNAIMMIDFALDVERREGKSPHDAIYQACLLRFRPIMMTTMAALLGGMPLAFGTGVGAELRRPLGISIVGGLIMSQMLTLFTTPVIYLYLDRFRLWTKSIFGRTEHALPAAAAIRNA